jgi:beta-phosphoglucomutase-like phosphatase (HAD superfamily)
MLKAVLLDIDGTLVDSNAVHAAAWSSASAAFGFERPASFFRPLIGMGGDRVLARIDPALTDDAEPGKSIAAKRGEFFRAEHLPTLKATLGAKELVERLHDLGLQCVVASSTTASDLDDLLDVAGVRERIDASTTADDAKESKPAPDIVASALQRANVSASEAIMIGDTPYDVQAAAGAGVAIIAMRCGGWGDADLEGAIEIYDDPADLLAHFDRSAIARNAQPRRAG